ncbi:MAG: phospholipase D-like domain-containing protein [bacterium]
MATFLATSGISHHLEQMLTASNSRLILVSPYLRVHEKSRVMLEELVAGGCLIQLVYGKEDLHPKELAWLKKAGIEVRFCENLHAKCYMSDHAALVTSMNLHQYSQAINYEMGFLVEKEKDEVIFTQVEKEVLRIVKVSVLKVEGRSAQQAIAPKEVRPVHAEPVVPRTSSGKPSKAKLLSTSELAKRHGSYANVLFRAFFDHGLIDAKGPQRKLTSKGIQFGGQLRSSEKTGEYIVWPEDSLERLGVRLD